MSSSTLVLVYHYIGRLYASISSINHIQYIALDNSFYICDAVVLKSLHITFLIHREQFAFHFHALKITIKLGFSGTLGGCMGCSLVKSGACGYRTRER